MIKKRKIYAVVMAVLMTLNLLIGGETFLGHIGNASVSSSGISFTCGKDASMAHVQSYGDTAGTVTYIDGIPTLNLGTTGQGKRLEAIRINMFNNTGYSGSIQYQVHVQSYGWMGWTNNSFKAGTTGQGKRLEGIRIRLTGDLAKYYDVRYRVHIQTYGDAQGWVYNGALAGTTGESKRLERLQVQVIPKASISGEPSVSYRVHRQTYGWENFGKTNGAVSGTTGQGKRLEGIEIFLTGGNKYSGGITYRTHIQTYGWEKAWKSDGEMSGTSGQAKRLEAIQIKLTGEIANYYDVYYRVHAQSYGWMNWVSNGASAGTSGQGKRLEAIQIVLRAKGTGAPETTYGGVTGNNNAGYAGNTNNGDDIYIDLGGDQTPSLPETPVTCQHNWVEQTVYHPAKTHVATWKESVYVGYHDFCNNCGMDLTVTFGGMNDAASIHIRNCGGGTGYTYKPVYDEVEKSLEVVDEPAYTEVTGYKCSKCGAVKN